MIAASQGGSHMHRTSTDITRSKSPPSASSTRPATARAKPTGAWEAKGKQWPFVPDNPDQFPKNTNSVFNRVMSGGIRNIIPYLDGNFTDL